MLKKKTLKTRFLTILFFTYLVLIIVIMSACYYRFYRSMVYNYKSIGDEILSLAVGEINADHIPDYLDKRKTEEHDNTQARLMKYVHSCREIYYMYAYQLNDDDKTAKVIFDAPMPYDEGYKLGETYTLEPDVAACVGDMRKGKPLKPLIDNTEYGYLLTCGHPLFDSRGVCQGYLLIDFNLTEVRRQNIMFILTLFGLVFMLTLVIMFFGMNLISAVITEPIEKMYLCISDFRYETNQDRKENVEKLKNLNIKTNSEIQSLYDALVTTTEDSYLFMREYRNVTEKLGIANEKAHTDVLTGFRNKTAYEERNKRWQMMIDQGETPELAVLMVDVNNLKYVNDQFGHKHGDEYIKGCCDILGNLCIHSEIYRIGGDEFVVMLQDADYRNAKRLHEMLRMYFHDCYTDEASEPWERYSASIGMAECLPGEKNISEVFKRADEAMYQAKAEFKEKYGSYR